MQASCADPIRTWDRLWSHAPTDERDAQLIGRERRSGRWSRVAERLRREFGRLDGLRTIEIGSGRGDLSYLLAECGAAVTLLDSSEQGLTQARRRFGRASLGAYFIQGDLFEPKPSWAGQFDVAISSGVIEHFRDERRTDALRAHRLALRSGGLAVISVPHAHCPTYRLWKFYLEVRRWWPYGLEIPYTKRELLRRANLAGFSSADCTATGFWQSAGDHVLKAFVGHGPDWAGAASCLDRLIGLSAILFARR